MYCCVMQSLTILFVRKSEDCFPTSFDYTMYSQDRNIANSDLSIGVSAQQPKVHKSLETSWHLDVLSNYIFSMSTICNKMKKLNFLSILRKCLVFECSMCLPASETAPKCSRRFGGRRVKVCVCWTQSCPSLAEADKLQLRQLS